MYSYASVIMTQSIEKSIMNDTIKYKKKRVIPKVFLLHTWVNDSKFIKRKKN